MLSEYALGGRESFGRDVLAAAFFIVIISPSPISDLLGNSSMNQSEMVEVKKWVDGEEGEEK